MKNFLQKIKESAITNWKKLNHFSIERALLLKKYLGNRLNPYAPILKNHLENFKKRAGERIYFVLNQPILKRLYLKRVALIQNIKNNLFIQKVVNQFIIFKNAFLNHRFFKKIKSSLTNPKIQIAIIVTLLAFWFCLPQPFFDDPTSMVLEDKEGNLMGARIANDGQWRFPPSDTVPEKFSKCIIEFEDRYFHWHLGVNPGAFGRAVFQNLRNTRVVSGGSTLTMQTIRMARKQKNRNILSKMVEAIQATRLELTHKKRTILAYYASNAPFGGNVVGIEAAAWRYFGKSPNLLSWGEAATLAVLPNAPALIHPGRNREALLAKRNRLLNRMIQSGILDNMTGDLAKSEPLPDQPLPLPQIAPHLLDRAFLENIFKKNVLSRVRTTIDVNLQQKVTNVLKLKHADLSEKGIHNLAVLVLDTETGNVLAYCGNAPNAGVAHNESVDIIKASRSTGSVLKPLLYAFAQQEGEILPNSLLIDVPTDIGGFHPENFHETYDGVIAARRALARSLNIPYVRLLHQYGLEKFYGNLKRLGISTFNQPPAHYGLTLVVGGAEGTLWELTGVYASMARMTTHWYPYEGKYSADDWHKPNYLLKNSPIFKTPKSKLLKYAPILRSSAAWLALNAMSEVERPDGQGNWELFEGSQQISWKTGTSFGFRDAWAIGVTPRYAIGVWVGNANGEGRPGLTGIEKAAPILFDIFNLLPTSERFDPPYDDMVQLSVCKKSGFRATELCELDTVWAAKGGEKVVPCPYHTTIHLDTTGQFQVSDDCEQPQNMKHQPWFVLPALEEYYHKTRNPSYQVVPSYRKDCAAAAAKSNPVQLIYPKSATKIYLPIDFNGKLGSVIFKAAHRMPQTAVYWHLDDEFVGTTKRFHELAMTPPTGRHRLTLVDEAGNRVGQDFEVIGKNN
jgi:penicillin-binding protein 1C